MRDVKKLEGRDMGLDIVSLIAGAVLLLTPWALGAADTAAAAWNAWIAGALIVAASAWALADPAKWQGWAALALGLWAIVSPWLLGFAAMAGVMYLHVIAGIVVAAIAAWELFTDINAAHHA